MLIKTGFNVLGLVAVLAATPNSASVQAQNASTVRTYQRLHIPEAISGKSFQLRLHTSKMSFWKGATTATYGYNNENYWGPTLIFNQGDTVKVDIKNDLNEPTTTHWHGMHIPAAMDGGPHQVIPAGATWSPSFVVKNNPGTYWYHPHVHQSTQKQLTYGAGGLIIVRDPIESALALPRTYGVDDIPLALTSRRFYTNDQFSFEGDNDKYGDYLFANGTLDPQVDLPRQFVRLRILNGEIERGYNLGFRDNRTFYLIATDGGLVDKPIPLKRMMLMVGERAEILVDLGADKTGSSVDLMAYNANHPFGFPGGEPGTGRPNGGYLNNIDFQILHINVKAPTGNPVTKLPEILTKNRFPLESEVSNQRTVRITADNPGQPFQFDNKPYVMHQANQVIKLGAVEKWTVTNNRIFGHSFHIHDVQFKIVWRSSGPVEAWEQGWKDTVYVPRDQSVSFVAKFEDYASETDAYMYHCHMANHEDGGLMGEFLVVKDPSALRTVAFREPTLHPVTALMTSAARRLTGAPAPLKSAEAADGAVVNLNRIAQKKPLLLFFIELNCPCSKDAAVYMNSLQAQYGSVCEVVGVINANPADARAWIRASGCTFPVLPDPDLKLITAFGAERAVYTTLVAPGSRIDSTYPGYSRETLAEISRKIARMAGVTLQAIDFSKGPETLVTGCEFVRAK